MQRRCVADDPASALWVLNHYKEIKHPFYDACLRGSEGLPRGLRDPSKATVPELEKALAIIEANKRPEAATDAAKLAEQKAAKLAEQKAAKEPG